MKFFRRLQEARVQREAEAAAMHAEGLDGPPVTEPRHRLSDLPPATIGLVVMDGMSFREALEVATRLEATNTQEDGGSK